MSNMALLGAYAGQDNSALMFRNLLVNGNCAIDQRNSGANQTITAAAAYAYTVDRWYAYSSGGNPVGARVAASGAYQFTGAASVTEIGFAQRIEAANSRHLAGGSATFSVDLSNSLLTTVTWTAFYANTTDAFGTRAALTRTQIATGTFTVSSTLSRYTATFSVPSAATTGIEIVLSVGAQTSGTWRIDNVMLEAGASATPFERRPIGVETALAQRYYYKVDTVSSSSPKNVSGYCITGQGHASISVTPPVTMRTNANISHNLADNQYVSQAPIGTQWSFIQDGNSFATKSGTAIFAVSTSAVIIYGATWNITARPLFGPSVVLAFDSEL